ncbi:MAG TPA: hypothetical protein VL048_12535 [Xanthobacteraceae bacterium]|nr:hypothetical protein [Xanthobacteraceae bacterium]
MADKPNTGNAGPQNAQEKKRFRSEIEFPYADLENAVELAQTIHSKAGTSCEVDELAAWMGQSANGGTFRTRLGAARMFGLTENAQGRTTLTQLGRDVLDGSGSERSARVTAFLNVELFRAIYEQYKGSALPPPPAIERQVEQLGVSPKQKERARQTFMKSAQYAGFIDSTTGRFVKPGITQKDEGSSQQIQQEAVDRGTGGGGGEPPKIDPIIQGLLARLPKSGEVWPESERKLWLELLAGSFKLIYQDGHITPGGRTRVQLKGEDTATERSLRYGQEIANESND